jgi:hypothetical protein
MYISVASGFLATMWLITNVRATQVNIYHDQLCDDYAYTVYSSDWSCQDIDGTESQIKVGSTAQCNVYFDTNCQSYAGQITPFQGNTCSGGSASVKFGSLACAV